MVTRRAPRWPVVIRTISGWLLVATLLSACGNSTDPAAERHKEILIGLPTGDLDAAGLRLISETSGAGGPGPGAASDRGPSVTRHYSFEAPLPVACEATIAAMTEVGWTLRDPDPVAACVSAPDAEILIVDLDRSCPGLGAVTGVLHFFPEAAPVEKGDTVRIRFETAHQDGAADGATSDPPPCAA
jgi:hypothetical protein